jgi:hypothetical protein
MDLLSPSARKGASAALALLLCLGAAARADELSMKLL